MLSLLKIYYLDVRYLLYSGFKCNLDILYKEIVKSCILKYKDSRKISLIILPRL